jgi:predicted dehydrogenase
MPAARWDSGRQLRVGVIGTGFGKAHVRAFTAHPRATVTAVCSTDAGRAAAVAAQLGVPLSYGEYRTLLAEAPVDAVVVTTPPDQHAPIAAAALQAGKHVLCEKPLTSTLAEAQSLLERARASGLVHAVVQWLRYSPGSLWTRELLADGAIGQPLSLVDSMHPNVSEYFANPNVSPNKHAWFASRARGGGFFLAGAPHLLDRLLWYFGPPTWVLGHVHTAIAEVTLPDGSRLACDAPDSFSALVSFADHPVAVVQCAPTAAAGTTLRLEIHGTEGSILLAGDPLSATVKIARGRDADYTDAPIPERLTGTPLPPGVHGPLLAMIDRFVCAVLDGEGVSPSFEDGYQTQHVIESILVSSEAGRRVPVSTPAPSGTAIV